LYTCHIDTTLIVAVPSQAELCFSVEELMG
jgi:hypothetical protein